jgi:hypothetical protein
MLFEGGFVDGGVRRRMDGTCYDVAVDMPSGLLNFMRRTSSAGATMYLYGVFPKHDVLGVLNDTQTGASAGLGGGSLNLLRRFSESRTESLLVGYDATSASALQAGGGGVRFGWVISAPGRMRPTQKSQLAVLSVPAWATGLIARVSTGWLDRSGRERRDVEAAEFLVRLPTDYEALDTLFRDEGVTSPGPRIADGEMTESPFLLAGRPGSILIPGSNLWRNTIVTVGAQTADRIRVLPDKAGIIADFEAIDILRSASRTASRNWGDVQDATEGLIFPCGFTTPVSEELSGWLVRPVALRVWTSEGRATAARPVCVVYDTKTLRRERVSAGQEVYGPAQQTTSSPTTATDSD